MMTSGKATWLMGFVLLAAGCAGCRKSDAERAAGERAEMKRAVEKSYALTPYRLVKLVVRSENSPDRPQDLDELEKAVRRLQERFEELKDKDGVAKNAEEMYRLAALFYRTRKLLERHDEDQFPLLYPLLMKESVPGPWYDNGAEHLSLATFWFAIELADRSNRAPSFEYAYYELSRAEAKETWPPELRALSFFSRGLLYCKNGYYYAADEELTRYIDSTQIAPAESFLFVQGANAAVMRPALLSAGYFARAWNRMGLDRDEQATADMEEGLKNLERIGVDNELTQWGWAFVHYKRGRYAEAGKQMDKLSRSPYLDEETRAEIRKSAEGLKKEDASKFFAKGRSGILVARALIARAGGLERILAQVLGEERAHKIYAPVLAMRRVQDEIARHSDPKKLAGEAGEKASELGKKGLDFLRDKVGGEADKPAK